MGKYFTVKELISSTVASSKGIDNTPNGAIESNINILIEQLDKIREKWGSPIYVNSGYRSLKLNKAVGGVSNSQHMLGCAADITTGSYEKDKELYNMIVSSFDYDQCIWEKSGSSYWIHYSYVRPNRKMKFNIVK